MISVAHLAELYPGGKENKTKKKKKENPIDTDEI